MFPPKKNPYPWENQIDNGGLGLPAPVSNAVSPPYVNPSQNIDPGGLGLPAPIGNTVSPPLQGNRQYSVEEQDFLRRNPGDEHRMAEALGSGGGTPNYTAPSQPPVSSPPGGDIIPEGRPANYTGPMAGREIGWGSGSLDELRTYTGQPNWSDAQSDMIRRVSGNPDWGKPMGGGNVGTPPPYVNPSMNPGGNMSNTPTPGITRPTGGVMQPKLPQGSAGGNMNVPPLSGQLPRTGEFQASRKRIPNYVGS